MDRRTFSGFVAGVLPMQLFAATLPPGEVRSAIVDALRSQLWLTDWAPRPEFGPLEKAYYCNVFVADVCRKAGAASWAPIEGRLGKLTTRDPVTREWENPSFVIRGWTMVYHSAVNKDLKSAKEILDLRQAGDVIVGLGHMGILSDDRTDRDPKVYSASAKTGAVEANDWSYRMPDAMKFKNAVAYSEACRLRASQFAVRRFVGA